MANQVAYNKKSIIDLSKDTVKVSYNTVERDGSKLSLVGKARCGFEYSFNTTSGAIKSEHLQLVLKAKSSNSEDVTRYNGNIAVLLHVQYWEEIIDSSGAVSGYSDGLFDVYKIYPYLTSENDGYFDIYTFDVENEYIENIYIEFINLSDSTVTFDEVTLNYSITVSQAVAETVGFDISLLGVDFYPNGFKVTYDGVDTSDKFYWNGDENDNLNGINVNGEKLIYINNHSELLE